MTVTDQRRQFVEFTESFLSLRSSALLKKPLPPGGSGGSPPVDGQSHHRHHHQLTNGEQLLTTDHVYGVLRDSPVQDLLSTSRDPTHRAMWARMSSFWPTTIVDSVQEGVERVRSEHFAFIVESPTAEYLATRRPCDLYATEPFLQSLSYAFAVRKGETALKAALDDQLRRMADSSELQMLYLRWWKDECARYGHQQHPSPAKFETASVPRRSNSSGSAIVASRSVGGRRYGNGADRPATMATCVATILLLLLPFVRIRRY